MRTSDIASIRRGIGRSVVAGVLALLAIAGRAHAQQSCMGDVNLDGTVDGADIGAVLAGWGPAGGPADLDGNGSVDGRDLGMLLANWGPCLPPIQGDSYGTQVDGVPGTIDTDLGPVSTSVSFRFELEASPPDSSGIKRIAVRSMAAMADSVPTSLGDTGTIGLSLRDQVLEGFWNTNTGQFELPIIADMSSWLLDQYHPSTKSLCLEEGGHDGTTFFDEWKGDLTGYATDTGGSMLISSYRLKMSCESCSIGSQRGMIVSGGIIEALKKLNLACPADRRVNKLVVCIQPVFLGTGADDAGKTGASFAAQQAKADEVWAKSCIEFNWKAPKYLNKPEFKNLKRAQEDDLFKQIDPKGDDKCLVVYFVAKEVTDDTPPKPHDSGDGVTDKEGTAQARIIVADEAWTDCDPKVDSVLAHELGHALGKCPHLNGSVMQPTGKARPTCPGMNPSTVRRAECDESRKSPLAKEKVPKAPCCLTPDA